MKHFGLLGKELGHSYSKLIHTNIYNQMSVDASYDLIECSSNMLLYYINELKNGKYDGFNVTIPYKIDILKYLDELSEEARAIGSVNTIALKDGKITGFNTDYYGFLKTIEKANLDVNKKIVYILGTGGASVSVAKALLDLGAKVFFVSRKPKSNNTIGYEFLERLLKIDMIVNTTPVGMYPNTLNCPISDNIINKTDVIIDLIYNPSKTLLVKKAKQGYNGLIMLVNQAIKSDEIWLDREIKINKETIIKCIGGK